MRTQEQMAAQEAMRAVAPGYRVIADAEGWPMVRGRKHGRTDDTTGRNRDRLDWIGGDQPFACFVAGKHTITQKLAKLLAIPGVRRHQFGDTEARLLVPPAAVPSVLAVIHGQRQRQVDPDQAGRFRPGARLQEPSEPGKALQNRRTVPGPEAGS